MFHHQVSVFVCANIAFKARPDDKNIWKTNQRRDKQ